MHAVKTFLLVNQILRDFETSYAIGIPYSVLRSLLTSAHVTVPLLNATLVPRPEMGHCSEVVSQAQLTPTGATPSFSFAVLGICPDHT